MGESLPLLPETLPDDHEDVVWGLQTATALWARGERREALVWVRRAAEAAGAVNADMRAVELAKQAVSIEEYIAALEAAPPEPEPKAPPSLVSFPSVAPGGPPEPISITHAPMIPADAPTLKGSAYAAPSDFEDNVGDRMSAPLLGEEDEIRDETIPKMDLSGMRDLISPVSTATPASIAAPVSTPTPPAAAPAAVLVADVTPPPFRAAPEPPAESSARPLTKAPPPPPPRTRSATLQPGVHLNLQAAAPQVPAAPAAPAFTPAPPLADTKVDGKADGRAPVPATPTTPPTSDGAASDARELEKQRSRKKQRAPILDPWADDPPDEPARFRVQHQVADTGPGSDDDVITSAALVDVTLRRKPPAPPPPRPKSVVMEMAVPAPAPSPAPAPAPSPAPAETDGGEAKSSRANGEAPARPPAPPPPRRTTTLTGQSIAAVTGAAATAPASPSMSAPPAPRPPTLAPASSVQAKPPPTQDDASAAEKTPQVEKSIEKPEKAPAAEKPVADKPVLTDKPAALGDKPDAPAKKVDASPRSVRSPEPTSPLVEGPKSVRPPPAPPRREPSIAPPPPPAAAAPAPPAVEAAAAPRPPSAAPPSSIPRELRAVAGLPLERVDAFADLPPELQKELAESAAVHDLGPNDERQGFGVLVVVSGVVDVCATIADIPAAMVAEGGVVPATTSIDDVVAVRAVATSQAKVATWTKAQIESSLKACPWVLEELVRIGDRYAALAGATMGPLGDLDDESRRRTLDMFRIRALRENEVYATAGQDNPGLTLVGAGELIVGQGDERPQHLGSGEIVFPNTVLDGSPAPRDVRAGEGGALLLTAARATTIELFSTMPMLLELLR